MNKDEPWHDSVAVTVPAPGPAGAGTELLTALVSQLGIVSIRAAVLDPASLDPYASWSLSTQKDAPHSATDSGPDSTFIAARDASVSLRDAPAEHTMVRKLSPRLWSFAWLLSPDQLVIVEARYRDRRDALDDKEAALVRLVFLNLPRESQQDPGEAASDLTQITWPLVDRRRGRDWRSQLRRQGLPLLLLGSSTLLATWLAVFALPAATDEQAARQTENSRLQTMAEQTVIEHLSSALAAGDYGELQDELSGFHALGYFPRAVVLNARQRVVATVGMGNEATIGAAVPVTLGTAARSVPLSRGSSELGRFVYLDRTVKTDPVSMPTLRALAAVSALTAMAAAVLLLVPLFRGRR